MRKFHFKGFVDDVKSEWGTFIRIKESNENTDKIRKGPNCGSVTMTVTVTYFFTLNFDPWPLNE